MKRIHFTDENGTFGIQNPENWNYLYFPIAGLNGLKSAVTPNLGGDAKLDQESFLLEPVSSENLHNNRSTRNFWVNGWSVTGASAEAECQKFTDAQDDSELTAGLMWHSIKRISKKYSIEATVTSFVPLEDNVEIMRVTLSNLSDSRRRIDPVAAIPIYGRSADNIRDHRNVTSMLHRIRTTDNAVLVKPTMSFDEKGHRRNHLTYFVAGAAENGEAPIGFYPTVDSFIGEGGSFLRPGAIFRNMEPMAPGTEAAGKEAMGGIRFAPAILEPGEAKDYILLMGIARQDAEAQTMIRKYTDPQTVETELSKVKEYWQKKVNVSYNTGNSDFDSYMRWVSFQPFLRRLYGCSFLPHHDYGRGGRGWRDLWQDCLSLLLMDPGDVRSMIVSNYGGVRIDGTNATIIGHKPGEFIADRNGISRVWMDHAFWPYLTTKLYMDQTGDLDVLLEKMPYFKDPLTLRGREVDTQWSDGYGNQQRAEDDSIYQGTILEHILVENLAAFYEVGEHNIIRLRGADWNDALDMANEHGESVAFTCAYAGNLKQIAETLRLLKVSDVELLEEIQILLDGSDYSVAGKLATLANYLRSCHHNISGKTVPISVKALAEKLEAMADWLMEHLRSQEWLEEGWFNSYYDNSKQRVEGIFDSGVRMMLTGQVFSIMSGTATDEQIMSICESADKYLYEKEVGGYRLNTDFQELKFDMGRMFGFAYGEKENGAVFSHMTVMYANALYKRGFAKEGWKALKTLAEKALDFETSRIYPGIPEYFNNEGRGMYHYLTGAASWYMMTMITEVFGVHGESGDLVVAPKLMAEQFDKKNTAAISLNFADKEFAVVIKNENSKEYGEYTVSRADCDGTALSVIGGKAVMPKCAVDALNEGTHTITIELK